MSRVLFVVAALLVASCGGDSSDLPATAPEIELSDPPLPAMFAASVEGWEGVEVSSLCLDVDVSTQDAEGVLSELLPDPEHGPPEEWMKVNLGSYGLPIVETGCDATLSVRLDMFALAEIYENAGQCYTGYDGRSSATLTAEGTPPVEAATSAFQEPPYFASENCSHEPVVNKGLWQRLLINPSPREDETNGVIATVLGANLWRALAASNSEGYYQGPPYDQYELRISDGNLHTPDSIALTAFYLNSPDAQARRGAGQFATYLAQTYPDRIDQLDPLVPYLISALEKAIDAEPFGDGDPYTSALRAITGQDIAPTAARWWDWWQANS